MGGPRGIDWEAMDKLPDHELADGVIAAAEAAARSPSGGVPSLRRPTGEGHVTKYISLWQPWASLFVAGAKMIETRSWGTSFRGRLAVHAGKKLHIDACNEEQFRSVLSTLGFDQPIDLPLGAVIGWVDVTDCLRMVPYGAPHEPGTIRLSSDPRLTLDERAFGNYDAGRYAWVTGLRFILDKPLAMRGLQRIQALPPDIARAFALIDEGANP